MFRSDFRCVSSKLFSEAAREDTALLRREPSRRRDKDFLAGVGPAAGVGSPSVRPSAAHIDRSRDDTMKPTRNMIDLRRRGRTRNARLSRVT